MRRTKLLLSIEVKGEKGEEALRKIVSLLHERLGEPADKEKDSEKPPEKKP